MIIAALAAAATAGALQFTPCRLAGVERALRCATLLRPENPDQPDGRQIALRLAVLPAVARRPLPDPVVVLAGGPGQAATDVARATVPLLARLNLQRDLVFLDQRGTGRDSPLRCPEPAVTAPLAQTASPAAQLQRLHQCLAQAAADPAQYATWIAAQDLEALRTALGASQLNLWGASYGTRLALDYLRQHPQRVRSAVLDGVAPPDMALPAAFARDSEQALRDTLAQCASDPACGQRHPDLAAALERLFARAAQAPMVEVRHPLTGRTESLLFDTALLAGLLRAPLYVPALTAVLPAAITQADRGDYGALLALAGGLGGGTLALGQHFAVVCAEDLPRVDAATRAALATTRLGAGFIALYVDACAGVPVRPVPAGFYTVGVSSAPVLLLSGGRDPATPPHHAARVAQALGPRATAMTAPNAGHGVSGQGCGPDLVTRFIEQAGTEGLDAACLLRVPPPRWFVPPGAGEAAR